MFLGVSESLAFRATGIHPFDKTVLTTAQMAPSVIYNETQVEGSNDMLPLFSFSYF
jgi:hypothetical protein